MHIPTKLIVISLLVMTVPPIVVIATHWDQVSDKFTVSSETAQGHVLYFTAPS